MNSLKNIVIFMLEEQFLELLELLLLLVHLPEEVQM
jgi:hypothetical protein